MLEEGPHQLDNQEHEDGPPQTIRDLTDGPPADFRDDAPGPSSSTLF